MGSEQSTQSGNIHRQVSLNTESSKQSLKRQQTIANPGGSLELTDSEGRSGSISPGPSVCSDIDLPYISYTVNQPIGDSPKLTNKQILKSKSSSRKIPQAKSTGKSRINTPAHNIVVVRGAGQGAGTEKDPEIERLMKIPMFLPIMRATLNLPAARDPEVLERLDPVPVRNLCLRYQHHLTTAANLVATEQNHLTQRVREVDSEIAKITNTIMERHKKYNKCVEKIKLVYELSHQLTRCHMVLNQTLESLETLNNYLDIEDRLEPFVWTTG